MKWNVGWGPFARCNMQCAFCYSRHVRKSEHELDVAAWFKFLEENIESIAAINYGTGENSLVPEWFSIADWVRKRRPEVRQSLTTNGYLAEAIQRRNVRISFRNAIDEVDISLDFADKLRHNRLRGHPQAWDWAVRTLDFCRHESIASTIVFLGTDETLDTSNLEGLFTLAQEYGAKLRMNLYRPVHGVNNLSARFIPSYRMIIEALEYVHDHHRILKIRDSLFSALLDANHLETDPSGVRSLRILPDGSITPSTYLVNSQFCLARVNEPNILERIASEHRFDSIVTNVIPQDCRDCRWCSVCRGGVLDRRLLWYGTLMESDPYCPRRVGNFRPARQLRVFHSIDPQSVHDGYLPTMFFAVKD